MGISKGTGEASRLDNSAAVQIQRDYYKKTANDYNDMHVDENDEHFFSLKVLESMIDYYKISSVLDVGAGTGRVALYFKEKRPELKVVSVEPVDALREQGYRLGLSEDELMEGDANKLQFMENEFDLVCEFGVLHHVPEPDLAVSEMLRVGKIAVFLSDSNNFGQGPWASRSLKQVINLLGLWRFFIFLKTKGKMYQISEGDGLYYSYSVFNNYKQLRKSCKKIHLLNTMDGGINLYRTSPHIALFGLIK